MLRIVKRFGAVFLAALILTTSEAAFAAEAEPAESAKEAETPAPETAAPQTVENSYELHGPDIYGETYCVIDGNTGEVLYSKDPEKKMYPASCTKMLTALLVLENVPDLSKTLTFTKSAIDIDPSSSTLEPKAMVGETMTVKDALYGMLLKSANECGAMLGEYVAGSEAAFADMMNAKAAEIGCTNSHFMNAYGIHHDEHYTTAHDLALILRACMQNERYRELNATKSYIIPDTNMCGARAFNIGHAMIYGTFEEEGVIGGKTGSTPQAGRCLATACEREGRYIITTVMKSTAENYYPDTSVLLEYTYDTLVNHSKAPIEWLETNDTVIPNDNVRVRYSPSVKGAVCGMAYAGEAYKRRAIYGSWSMIEYEGKLLYVVSSYLESQNPELVPVTEAYVYTTEAETSTDTESAETEETKTDTEEEETAAETTERHGGTIETQDPNAVEKPELDRKKVYDTLAIVIPAAAALALLAVWGVAFAERMKRNNKWKRRKKKF